MPRVNVIAAVRRAGVAVVLVSSLCNFSAHAAAVTVDGDLTDLAAALNSIPVNDTSYVNVYRGTDPMGNVDSPTSESNNGFDISNVYAYYSMADDTFYLGMSFFGTVGNSLPVGSAATNEGLLTAGAGSNDKNAFDANETYGIQLYFGSSTSDPQIFLYSVKGANNSTDTVAGINNPYSLTFAHAISESSNGVEFGVTGLVASGAFSPPYPNTVTIRFSAGSADTNVTSGAAEDYNLVTMQVVPVPAAVWLFGSGLLGLAAVARKHRNNRNNSV